MVNTYDIIDIFLIICLFFCCLEVGKKRIRSETDNVADPGSLSRIPDLDFYPSRIQQLQQKEKGGNFVYLFCSLKFDKIENYFIFEQVKKKNLNQF
jgi:hypothetical protein